MTNPSSGSPLGLDRPTVAYIVLTNGERIDCTIIEQAERDEHGHRVFEMSPVREITRSETIDHCYADVLPPRTTAAFAIPAWALPVAPQAKLSMRRRQP